MDKTIIIQVRNVWGVQTVYPICAQAQLFAKLAGTTTLTRHALQTIEALGYTITMQPEVIKAIPGLSRPVLVAA
jgi:hypothetical protein